MKQIEHSGETCQVTDKTLLGMFRELSPEEVIAFRAAADNEPEGTRIKSVWHPVYQSQLFENGRGIERW